MDLSSKIILFIKSGLRSFTLLVIIKLGLPSFFLLVINLLKTGNFVVNSQLILKHIAITHISTSHMHVRNFFNS